MNPSMTYLLHDLLRVTWLLHWLGSQVIPESMPCRLVRVGSVCEGSGPVACIACFSSSIRDVSRKRTKIFPDPWISAGRV